MLNMFGSLRFAQLVRLPTGSYLYPMQKNSGALVEPRSKQNPMPDKDCQTQTLQMHTILYLLGIGVVSGVKVGNTSIDLCL